MEKKDIENVMATLSAYIDDGCPNNFERYINDGDVWKLANALRNKIQENEKLWKWVKQSDEPLSREEERKLSEFIYKNM